MATAPIANGTRSVLSEPVRGSGALVVAATVVEVAATTWVPRMAVANELGSPQVAWTTPPGGTLIWVVKLPAGSVVAWLDGVAGVPLTVMSVWKLGGNPVPL